MSIAVQTISNKNGNNLNRTVTFWSRYLRQKSSIIGLIFVCALTLGSIFSTTITNKDPNAQGNLLTKRYLSPSTDHPFGTDKFGRDVLSRVLFGGRISLSISFSVVILSMSIGLIYGTVSGYFGSFIDTVMMRLLDFNLAFPTIFLVITVLSVFQLNHWYLVPVLALTGWMETARIVRAEVLSLKERDFILAVKGLGFNHSRIIFRHLIPNCIVPVIIAGTFKIGEVILLESALSFIGIGVQPPIASWGSIINDGRNVLLSSWWIATFPGIFIALTVISFNLVADGLNESLNI